MNIGYKGDRMKKIKKLLLGNIKTVVAFILGVIVSGTTVYAATILFASNQVGYDNTSSGLTSTNVQDALDELYTKAQNMVPIDPNTFNTNTAKTVYASSKGVCIKRNNKLNCFKINNWSEEQNHIQQVFSDISCYVYSSSVGCFASDFTCYVSSYGSVRCDASSDDSHCNVDSDGSVSCN